jgi:hypothetical protein
MNAKDKVRAQLRADIIKALNEKRITKQDIPSYVRGYMNVYNQLRGSHGSQSR